MAATLRQLQRWLHASRASPRGSFGEANAEDIGQFAGWLRGDSTSFAVCRNGQLASTCDCENCNSDGPYVDARVSRLVDSLAKKHGAGTTLAALTQQAPPEGFKNPNGDKAEGDGEDGEDGEGGENAGQGDGDGQESDDESDGESGDGQPSSQPQRETPEQASRRYGREVAEERKKKLEDIQQQLKNQPANASREQQEDLMRRARQAKGRLKSARAMASKGKGDGPSLQARKRISGTHGRLQKVSPALRAEMATLINMLVGQGRAAGGQMGPIPVLSPRKLVSRMLVQRPLANALKEDVVTGRPVTLFLPDVSPSCALQAQAACDVANAAGYSGVSGSDVLVFPHSNGLVDEYADEYVPWFNGKPATTDRKEIKRLFNEVTTGKGKWRVRAVVIIGDHDGEYLYRQLAEFKRIARLIWLHNESRASKRGELKLADNGDNRLYAWQPKSLQKLSMVYGCVTQPHMVKGLKMALQSQ